MPRAYRLGLTRRTVNIVVRALVPLGLPGRRTHLLTVVGRRSGRRYSTPVSLVEHAGERWLVAPYGERSWVRNARAAGWVEITRRGRSERLAVTELRAEEAVPVLREYYRRGSVTRPFFDVDLDSSDSAWVAEAPHHPVFRFRELGQDSS